MAATKIRSAIHIDLSPKSVLTISLNVRPVAPFDTNSEKIRNIATIKAKSPSGAFKKRPEVKKAADTAKKEQPKKRPVLDGIARQVLKGMDRHKKAMARAKSDIETTKKIASKVGKGAKEFGKGFASGVKTVGKVAKSIKKEEFSPAQIAALEANGFVELDEAGKKCWKGYKKAGTQKLFGKTYNRCVKEGSFTIDPKAHNKEKRAAKIGNLARNTSNPGEKEAAERKAKGPKLYGENITIEDANGNTFAEIIDVIKNPLVSESCCSKCGKEPCECGTKRYRGGSAAKPGPDKNYVKPMGEEIEEAVRLPTKTGNIVAVNLTWRGKYLSIKIFFPNVKVPSRTEIQTEIEKVYPGARVYNFMVSDYEPGQPLLQVTNEDWQKVNKKDKTDGMSPAAVKAYRRENPGSKLKTAVTGNPKKGSKDAKRRKSYCARSKGQQDMHNISCSKTPDKPVCKARRRWKC